MAKGWATPKSKKKRQRLLTETEKKWLLGMERMRKVHQLKKGQEAQINGNANRAP